MMELNPDFAHLLRKAYEEPAQQRAAFAHALAKVLAEPSQVDAMGRIDRVSIDSDGTSRPSAMAQKTDAELLALIDAAPSRIPPQLSSSDYRRRADAREAMDELFLRSLQGPNAKRITLIPASAAAGQDISLGTGKLTPIQRG